MSAWLSLERCAVGFQRPIQVLIACWGLLILIDLKEKAASCPSVPLPAPHLFLSLPEEIMKLKCRKAKRFQKGFEAMMLSIAAGGWNMKAPVGLWGVQQWERWPPQARPCLHHGGFRGFRGCYLHEATSFLWKKLFKPLAPSYPFPITDVDSRLDS